MQIIKQTLSYGRFLSFFLLIVVSGFTPACINHTLTFEPIKDAAKIITQKPITISVVDNPGIVSNYVPADQDFRLKAAFIPLYFYTTVKDSVPARQTADFLADTLRRQITASAEDNLNGYSSKIPLRLQIELVEGGMQYYYTAYGGSLYVLLFYMYGFMIPFDYACSVGLTINARLVSPLSEETIWGPKAYRIKTGKYTRPALFNYVVNRKLAEDVREEVSRLSTQILNDIENALPPADNTAFYNKLSPLKNYAYDSLQKTPLQFGSTVSELSPQQKVYAAPGSIVHNSLVVKSMKGRNVAQNTADALSDIIVNVLSDYSSVQSMDALAAINSILEEKLKAGCDDTRCIIEVAGAMDISQVVTGSISKLGPRYIISLMLIQTKGDSLGVVQRASEECDCSEGELIDVTKRAAQKLIGVAR